MMPARNAVGDRERIAIWECLDYYKGGADPGYDGVFERRYCSDFVSMIGGGGYADAVFTGTAALYVAIGALQLPAGSSVLCSPITDPGTLSAIILNGLRPRLMDAAPGGYNVGPMQVIDRVAPDVSAICVVHAAGKAADMPTIARIAKRHGLPVIEDCSQAHFAAAGGQPVGTWGTIAAFSTMYRKAHHTGPCGGVVYTRDLDLHRRALALADRGKARWVDGYDDRNPETFLGPALNLHQSELACAIGIASLARVRDTIDRRLGFVWALEEYMRQVDTIFRLPPYSACDSPFILPIGVHGESVERKIAIAEAVRAEGVPLNPHYRYLVARWPWVKPHLADDFGTPTAAGMIESTFCLYLHENYGQQHASTIAHALVKIDREFR